MAIPQAVIDGELKQATLPDVGGEITLPCGAVVTGYETVDYGNA